MRSQLHARGLRFRKDMPLRAGGLLTRPDIVFTRARLAIFVDGCFWHRCPDHFVSPKTNAEFWERKLTANVERDRRVDAALRENGWEVVRLWEHEDATQAADAIARVLQHAQRSRPLVG